MKNLNKYIRNHRDELDDQEPPEGHVERFEALLDKQSEEKKTKRTPNRFHLFTALAVAASLAIIAVIGIHFLSPDKSIINLADDDEKVMASAEFFQTNDYYKTQMEIQIEDIMCKIVNADPETRIRLQKDLETILADNKDFVKQMEKSDNEEMAIYYLVEHYRANIQVLEFINEKLGTHLKC